VSSGDDGARVQEGTTADVRTAALQANDEGELACCGNCSADNSHRVLGSRSSGDCRGHEASEDHLVLHLDVVLGSEC
jgi:hypothetical protein